MTQLEETEKKLLALQGGPTKGGEGDAAKALTDEQKAEVAKFTEDLLKTRKALRQVRHNLHKDIDSLRNRLSFINIALVPILVTIAAAGLGMARVKRRKNAVVANASRSRHQPVRMVGCRRFFLISGRLRRTRVPLFETGQ